MEAIETLLTRRSCRAFTDEMPSKDLVAKVCEVGSFAPTGHGKQSPIIVAITNKVIRDRLSRMNADVWAKKSVKNSAKYSDPNFDPFYNAPVVILVLADKNSSTAVEDGSAVITTMLNAAHGLGLASCWIHRAKEVFDSEEGQAILRECGIEEGYIGIDHVALGYPAKEIPAPMKRKEDYIRWVE